MQQVKGLSWSSYSFTENSRLPGRELLSHLPYSLLNLPVSGSKGLLPEYSASWELYSFHSLNVTAGRRQAGHRPLATSESCDRIHDRLPGLSFLICTMGIIIPSSHCCWEG